MKVKKWKNNAEKRIYPDFEVFDTIWGNVDGNSENDPLTSKMWGLNPFSDDGTD